MSEVELDRELRVQLDDLARACRILEMEGHGDMTLGHLSLRAPDGRGLWMKRNRMGLGEILGADDFVLLDWDGQQLYGKGTRHSEWPIHSEFCKPARTSTSWRTRIRFTRACFPHRSIR